jgi:plasmid stability protein
MPTLTIRNVPPKVVAALKAQAKQHNRSMEQELRALLEGLVSDRASVLAQVRESWDRQSRRPDAAEVKAWLDASRP